MTRFLLACLTLLLVAAGADSPLDLVRVRLARGDAAAAEAALRQIAEPAADRASERAAWLDAQARVAWSRGRLDLAFARSMEAQALAERARERLPDLTPDISPGRAWVDETFRLPLRALPTGDSGTDAATLAASLRALPEASTPWGAWLVWAARLLDPSVPPPAPLVKPAHDTPEHELARRRVRLLQAACELRQGVSGATAVMPTEALKPACGAEGFARWFQAEALAREGERNDPRLAAVRFVQAAAAFDDSPWLRVAAFRRAATTLHPIDPAEAARLRAAADKETP